MQNHMAPSLFKPHPLLKNRHLQTIWRTLFSESQFVQPRFGRFELNDGDFIDFAYTPPRAGPILLILHGLEGSYSSPYAQGMLNAAKKRDWQGMVMHFRGCSGSINRTLVGYHSGETKDLAQFLEYLRNTNPSKPIYAVGFSLGGNVLLKYLGESKEEAIIDAAVAVSVPYSLKECSQQINSGLSKLYGRMLLNSLKESARRKMRIHQTSSIYGLTLETIEGFKTIREFDDRVVAPMWGFQDALDYYEKCSSKQFLRSIARPTLLIHSRDDPFMTPKVIPKSNDLAPETILEVSRFGGHVGFIQGPPWKAHSWLDQRIPHYFETLAT